MTNTKKQPFLAKPSVESYDDSVIHIIRDEQDRLEAISDYGYDDLIPLTAEEVWELMPWQSMETAPKDGTKVMILFSGGLVIGCYRKNAWRDGSYIIFPKKWLPFPGAKNE